MQQQTSFSWADFTYDLCNVSIICLETLYSSIRSSCSDYQYDSIPFEMVDGHQLLHSRNAHSSRSQCIPLYGCQSLQLGSSSRTNESILSWLLVGRPIPLRINMLEIMAIGFTLKKAIKYIRHSCVMISTDNTTMVSYINKQGGTHSPNLCVEVWEILHWCLEQDVVIRVQHTPGKFNVLTDRLSRIDKPLKTEWALDQSVANSIFRMLSHPNVDLFATYFNRKLPLLALATAKRCSEIHALSMDANHLRSNQSDGSISLIVQTVFFC